MELRAGYKQTEVGVIPERWAVMSFQHLLDFRNGINADKGAYGKGLPFVNVLEVITKGHLKASDITGRVTIAKSVAEVFSVRRGDMVFNRSSETPEEVGLSSVYLDTQPAVFGGFVIRGQFRNDLVDPIYSGYAFRAPAIRKQIVARGQGAIRANIGQADLKQVVAPIPPMPEQCAIANALSDVDALLAKIDQLIAKKRDLKQAAMQQLLTGQTRLPGFSGEWEVKRLGDLLSYEQPTPYLVRSAEYDAGNSVPVLTAGKTFILGYTNETDGVYSSPPVIIFDDFTTASKFVDFHFKAKSSAMKILKAREGRAHIRFAFERMQIIDFQLGDHKRYWISEYSKLPIETPSLVEQTAIATVLSDMDAELAALEARRDKTRALKQGMMQALLTGRIRLI